MHEFAPGGRTGVRKAIAARILGGASPGDRGSVARSRPVIALAAGVGLLYALGACAGRLPKPPTPKPLTMVSSFPENALAVCFVTQTDRRQLGCTRRPRIQGADGSVDLDGRILRLERFSPDGRVAVVQSPEPTLARGEVIRIHAVAFNEAGTSELSADTFRITATRRQLVPARYRGVDGDYGAEP